MNFDTYGKLANETDLVHPINYYFLGLVEEAGEVAGLRKRFLRDEGNIEPEKLAKELGDVLWYVAMIGKQYGLNMDSIAVENIRKLTDRKERGVITGTGDER
jgi:NTP pyrophosphatase (non-canonical NTP hydrolase)